jgi:hypothetical protein
MIDLTEASAVETEQAQRFGNVGVINGMLQPQVGGTI